MKKLFVIFTALVSLAGLMAGEKGLEIGDKVAPFEAKADDGTLWKSGDVLGKKYLVVYFYPAAMTGGCTKQACAFRDHKADLEKVGAEVVGVSGDLVEGLKYFKMAENLNFTLLSDAEGKIARLFGVPTRDGGEIKRTVNGQEVTLKRNLTTARWTFILDKEGKVIYKDSEVKAAQDSDNVIAFLKKYQSKDKA